MSAIHFEAGIGTQKIQSDINKINGYIGNMSKNIQKEGAEIDRLAERIGRAFVGIFSVYQAAGFIKSIAQVRGEFQQLEVSFETMLRSKEKADQMMADVVQFAIRTPYGLKDIASGTKQLLAFGIEAEKIMPTLKALGDVSAGLSVPIERLIVNYGQVRTQTRLTGRDLRDFQTAGVPVVAELAKNLNVAESAIADMVTAGKIGFADVEKAFITMTSEGGRFTDLMEQQAKTITGLSANFADAWDRMLNSIGKENEGIIAGSIRGATTLVENYEEIIKILKVLIATYGAYKAAVIATTVAQRASVAAGNIQAWFQLASGIKTAKDAQIQLVFEDKTVITLGSESELKIEEYLNDAAKPKAKFKFGEGSFKSITGQIGKTAPENFTLETKTATIGIRGTTVKGKIGENGDSIGCTSGSIIVKVLGGSGFVVVPAGKITFVAPGKEPTPPKDIKSGDLGENS